MSAVSCSHPLGVNLLHIMTDQISKIVKRFKYSLKAWLTRNDVLTDCADTFGFIYLVFTVSLRFLPPL